MPVRKPIQIGTKFARLTVTKEAIPMQGARQRIFKVECLCECGNTVLVWEPALKNGTTKSCGCYMREIAKAQFTTHGNRHLRAYRSWDHMIQRCTNPNNDRYAHYGGRGITVCARWRSFENFLVDMGEAPLGHSIERKDNDKGYSPDNCKWATVTEQSRNTSRNKTFTVQGATGCMKDLCNHFGKTYHVVRRRVAIG